MPRTRECDFCGGDIEPGTGTMFVHTDGSTVHFCSAKCEKNSDLGRQARDLEWTQAGRDAAERAAARAGDGTPAGPGSEDEADAAADADEAPSETVEPEPEDEEDEEGEAIEAEEEADA